MLDEQDENGSIAPLKPEHRTERKRARDLLDAIRTMKNVEASGQPASDDNKATLARFGGFGPIALKIFPDPATGEVPMAWRPLAAELRELLTDAEYASAKRSTFNAFYTSPAVMAAAFAGLDRLGVPADARVLEPGCGAGGFIGAAPAPYRFTGVEQEVLSGRIARLLHPEADIRVEGFQDTRRGRPFDAVVGNVPFGDVAIRHDGHSFSLHDFFFAKALDLTAPGGVMALVTSRYTLDKLNGEARDYLADRADLLDAIRLPDDAFKEQGTKVVTDLVFLRKRHPGEPEADPTWRRLGSIAAVSDDGERAYPVNAYFEANPHKILGVPSLSPGMHGRDTLRVAMDQDFERRLATAVAALPKGIFAVAPREHQATQALDVAIPPGLGEGSFFVSPTGAILQVEGGEALRVHFGNKALSTFDKGMTGPRLGALIGLRDDARAVLRAQNEDRPMAEREATRRALNRTYDRFVARYGPINKTTLSLLHPGTARETEMRRMPNVARFREDPDAFLVMSLEEYDEEAGTARKAAIMRQDVVGHAKPVLAVTSAEEGLAVALNERGRIDLDHIARLYGRDPDAIVTELGELVFHDPESGDYVTRDAYLSGDVRRKLAAALASKDGRHKRNVSALEAVQPEDLLPGDIDANLGAPWIPVDVLQAFAADLFEAGASSIRIQHLPKDALWVVNADHAVHGSASSTSEFGTGRADGITLFEQALNLRTPTIYDTHADGTRTLNQVETVAALEKQKRIKDKFKGWVFDDPDRAERLVRIYNDGFNNLRLREFDGSHLTFPGMNASFQPRAHQAAAVWRVMTDGNTLLAHTVGAGKTGVMAMACMKLRQTGLAQKPLVQVPNHMLEQFGREFMHIYPNARLLVAGKEDLARDRRKLLTAKIATGDWDAIIMTHSSFERVGMSPEFQGRFLQRQIDDYEDLLRDAKMSASVDTGRAGRSMLKQIEKRKVAFEEKLKAIAAEDKKDDGLVFDELGVDWVFTDEHHMFKNLETATKMDRVAGIQTTGSQRAFDLLMKARYLDGMTPGRGMVGASGTPISNSMVEMFTMQRFFDPAGLEARGIAHFDAWAAAFGEVVTLMEISPDGASLRPNNRFAKFVNLPELQQQFRSFADVQTADMLKLPVPAIRGGKAEAVSRPMSDWQRDVQLGLVKRYERIRRGGVDPREDNALAITTDGRKLALDARLLAPLAADNPDSKLNAAVENVAAIWRETAFFRGAQLIFCDIGVNSTEWGFSVYDDIRSKLGAAGIPTREIAFAGDADTDAKKAVLFAKVRSGQVRVLIGSTAKMGAGTNVQERLAAIHHVDAPWKPAEIEQRDGRGVRQGNTCPEIGLYRYVTKGSFDAFMWQGLENKARFITQIMKGDLGLRRADDIGGQELTFAEVKAIASGNPAVLRLAEIEADLQRLSILRRAHADDQYRVRTQLRLLPQEIARLGQLAAHLDADHATALAHADEHVVLRQRHPKRADAVDALNEALHSERERSMAPETRDVPLGAYRGLELILSLYKGADPEMVVQGVRSFALPGGLPAGAILNRIDRHVDGMPAEATVARDRQRTAIGQLASFEGRAGVPFEQEGQLTRLTAIRNELEAVLAGKEPETAVQRTDELVAEYAAIKALGGSQAPQKPIPATMSAEPVETAPRTAPAAVPAADRAAAVVLPFPAPATVSLPEPARQAERVAAARLAPMPTKQGSLFDEPAPGREGEKERWTSKIQKGRVKPRQLSFF